MTCAILPRTSAFLIRDSRRLHLRKGDAAKSSCVPFFRSWAVGDPEYIEKNMPVVAGFRGGMELAPMMVCENSFAAILGDGEPESVVDVMVQSWINSMP
jgi:hypothetical protein